ncbi:MAG: c-type cytochrome [Caulobacterales bacterium]|jgi:cytochrome c2
MPRLTCVRSFAVLAFALSLSACHRPPPNGAWAGVGDPARGHDLIIHAGCGACHRIPGVSGANGRVGPPLDGMAERTIIAGMLPNTPGNMIHWLEAPQSVVPGNAMPNMELDDHDARDIAAYIYSLR